MTQMTRNRVATRAAEIEAGMMVDLGPMAEGRPLEVRRVLRRPNGVVVLHLDGFSRDFPPDDPVWVVAVQTTAVADSPVTGSGPVPTAVAEAVA